MNVICIPIRNYAYKTMRGLSEEQIKRRLERRGWRVWRGGYIKEEFNQESQYEEVRVAYRDLLDLLNAVYPPEKVAFLQCFPSGMPDFLAYNSTSRRFKFVECKLGHEQLSQRQRKVFLELEAAGFAVEIWKLVFPETKTRLGRWEHNLQGTKIAGRTRATERDAKLTKRLLASRRAAPSLRIEL